jgi:alpha-mannosidase
MDVYYRYIEKVLSLLKKNIVTESKPVENILYKECTYKTGSELPKIDDTFRPFAVNERWAEKPDTHAWFYFKTTIAEAALPYYNELCVDTEVDGWNVYNPQFLVYINGHAVQGLDTNHRSLPLDVTGESEVFIFAYSGSLAKNLLLNTRINTINKDIEKLYYDILVPYEVLGFSEEDSKEYADIKRYLLNAVNLLDLREPLGEGFRSSVKRALEYLSTEFYGKRLQEQQLSAFCVGHTHIDVAWLWTLSQTKEKAQRTFSTVLKLMEKYPDFVFFASQPQLYMYVKEEAPEIYDRIKEMVKAGRWEAEGAMWVEADCNLTSGESLIRQIVYGKRFFKEEFGVESRILWLPDVFGYSAALPQICAKSGIDYFITSKISWNDTNKMPYDTFFWKGIDGSRIFTYFLTAQDKEKGRKPVNYTTYVSTTDPKHLAGAYERYSQKELTNEVLVTFGWGDGGGGPTKKMLEIAERQRKGMPSCPKVKTGRVSDFLDNLYSNVKDKPYLPEWVGELYLEYHRGTYTSAARNKKNNRKSELLYQQAELLSCMAESLTSLPYPARALSDGWHTILVNQFHDILPGSSIPEVYKDSDKQYKAVLETADKLSENAYKSITDHIDTDGGVVVFNPHSFVGNDIVLVDGEAVYAENIPPKGYKVIRPSEKQSTVTINGKTIENLFFRVEFDDLMQIKSLFDKRVNRQVIKDGQRGNVLRVYEDIPFQYDCWNVEIYHKDKSWIVDDVVSCEEVRNGARSGFKVVKRFMSSTITQNIWVYDDIDRIDFETEADWQEVNLLLKAEFTVDINADNAVYDIQFGHTRRPTHSNTSWDMAKFEVCAQKYADLSDFGYGVSLINDCKYGYDIHGNTMKLSLLKCSNYPNEFVDKGVHTFTYSLFPHPGDFRSAGTIKHSYYVNHPMTAVKTRKSKGCLPESYSFIGCDKENVVVETVKKSESGDGVVIRMYESFNMHTKAVLTFGDTAKKVFLCDMLENVIEELPLEDGMVQIKLKPFEIVTVKVRF